MRTATAEQKERTEARRAAFCELAGKVAAMPEAQRLELASRLPLATIEGRALSPFNACLVASQAPNATIVGGFRQWLKAGRAVRKGEHGLALWVPTTIKGAEGAEGETRFLMGTVFDVTQTEPMPEGARA